MSPEKINVLPVADEAFMEEEGGPMPRLVHSNDEHPRFELIDRDRFHGAHR